MNHLKKIPFFSKILQIKFDFYRVRYFILLIINIMITEVIRVALIYILVLFLFRLMGKRQLGQMQPFELVLTLIIADLATIPMAEMNVPLLNGIIPLLTLVVFHFILTTLTKYSTRFSKFISGKPIIVVGPNGIVFSALKQLNITIDDLFEAIRGSGFFSFEEVLYVIMETNGQVSVMPKPEFSPVVNQDMNIQKQYDSLPLTIISEGKFMEENLKISNKPKEFYLNILKKEKVQKIKDVLILTISKQGKIFFQKKHSNSKIISKE